VERIAVSTVVYLPPEPVYEFLLDFPRYSQYSKYLKHVEQTGDGGPGTRYRLRFAWWKLSYTAHTAVTDVTPPERIEWTVTRHIDAEGHWRVEAVEAPDDRAHATRVTFVVDYRPGSVDGSVVDLPALVSLDWVVDRVEGFIRDEGERVVERIVADLEGERRPVDLDVEH
jgi:uncharacterized membrane protein